MRHTAEKIPKQKRGQISLGVLLELVLSLSRSSSLRDGICSDDVTEIACKITTLNVHFAWPAITRFLEHVVVGVS